MLERNGIILSLHQHFREMGEFNLKISLKIFCVWIPLSIDAENGVIREGSANML